MIGSHHVQHEGVQNSETIVARLLYIDLEETENISKKQRGFLILLFFWVDDKLHHT